MTLRSGFGLNELLALIVWLAKQGDNVAGSRVLSILWWGSTEKARSYSPAPTVIR